MIKLTVQQYANNNNTSVQQVYRQIKKGSLTTVKENGKTLVITEEVSLKHNSNNTNEKVKLTIDKQLTKENKWLNKQLKELNKINQTLHKKIERLYKKLDSKNKKVEQTLLTYISELKQFQLEHKSKEDIENIEISTNKKKSKKKKDKK